MEITVENLETETSVEILSATIPAENETTGIATDIQTETTTISESVAMPVGITETTTAVPAFVTDIDTVSYRETVVTVLIVQTFILSAILGTLLIGKFLERFK